MKKFSKRLIGANAVRFILMAIMVFIFVLGLCYKENSDGTTYLIENGMLIAILSAIGAYIFLNIYSFLFIATSGYEFNEAGVVCIKGVLFKKKTILDYSKMNAINIKTSLINRIFGVSALTIDSGATYRAELAEICIFEDSNIALELYNRLKNKENNDNKESEEIDLKYKFNSKTKGLYVLINTFATFFVSTTLFILTLLIAVIIINIFELSIFTVVLVSCIAAYSLAIIITAGINFCLAIVKYYDFNIVKNNDVLELNYGLIERHKNIININKIKAVKVEQGLAERIFRFCKIKLELIGYIDGDDQNITNGILIPLCKISEVNSILEGLGIDNKLEDTDYKSNNYLPFITYKLLFPFIGLLIFNAVQMSYSLPINNYELFMWLAIGSSIVYLLYALLVIGLAFLEKGTQGATIKDDRLIISSGVIRKITTITNKKNIIGIEDVTTKFRRKKGIYSYIVHIHTNSFTNTIFISIMDEKLKNELETLLIL